MRAIDERVAAYGFERSSDLGDLHDAFRSQLGVGNDLFELTARAWAVAGSAPA